ncbi:hypothetical protein WICMUC_001237 [Wickerhamomyces mucosus]|uniref:Mitochondrial inner membrane protease subunit 2 n=1 Tax=Wickerhamomyces mucosus TaxID=1378264 RepID=A0A9P8PVQ5_9ASCO|nr:hypothetical protein WICMUC_001237 [Wickerhamomyces mucosus]
MIISQLNQLRNQFNPTRLKSTLKYTSKWSFLILSWIPVLMVFNEHVIYIGKIEGSSMRPTFNPSSTSFQDWVLLWKFGIKDHHNGLKHNDIVLFKSPENPNKILCKRIKALQGDIVVTRHPYPRETCVIPRNHLWVEGDNIHSIDSNNFGPISKGLVVGKATKIIWPWNRIGDIPNGGREVRLNKIKQI